MGMTSAESRWFAIRVKSNRERMVAAALRGKGYEDFLPLYRVRRRWSDRVVEADLPLFSGYVFCCLDPSRRLPILTIPGVVGLVGNRQGPIPVDDDEIATLRLISGAGVAIAPWPFLQVGRQVRIDGGPLRGLAGLLIELKNCYRVVVSVSILQRSVSAEVDRDSITPLSCRPAA